MQSTFNLDKPGQLSGQAIRAALQSIHATHHGVTFTKDQIDTIYAIGVGGTQRFRPMRLGDTRRH
jgi:hypothetical protein